MMFTRSKATKDSFKQFGGDAVKGADGGFEHLYYFNKVMKMYGLEVAQEVKIVLIVLFLRLCPERKLPTEGSDLVVLINLSIVRNRKEILFRLLAINCGM